MANVGAQARYSSRNHDIVIILTVNYSNSQTRKEIYVLFYPIPANLNVACSFSWCTHNVDTFQNGRQWRYYRYQI